MDTPPQSRSGRRQLLDRFMNSRQVGSAPVSQTKPDFCINAGRRAVTARP